MSNWWMWAVFLLVVLIAFGLVEGLALRHPDRQWTLSKCMATLGARFPLSLVILGTISGWLSFHFWGHFCM
jgi:hypothetical protein